MLRVLLFLVKIRGTIFGLATPKAGRLDVEARPEHRSAAGPTSHCVSCPHSVAMPKVFVNMFVIKTCIYSHQIPRVKISIPSARAPPEALLSNKR